MLLLTGATGYLGRAVLSELLERGVSVRLATRRAPSGSATWKPLHLEALEDIKDETFAGISGVIHCAGLAHRSASSEQYEELNTEAVLKLAALANRFGVKRFLFVSTLNVVPHWAEHPDTDVLDYPIPKEPYAASKWFAEKQLSEYCNRKNISLCIVRPALIYDLELTANLAKLMLLLKWWPCALPRRGWRCLVSRPDVASLIANRAVNVSCPSREILAATDGELYDSYRIGRAISGRQSAWPVPDMTYRLGALLMDLGNRSGRRNLWKTLSKDHWCAIPRRIDGWMPKWTLESRLAEGNRS